MAYENLLYEKKDKIGYITFNRPKVLNALNRKTMEELGHLLSQAREDAEVGIGPAEGDFLLLEDHAEQRPHDHAQNQANVERQLAPSADDRIEF